MPSESRVPPEAGEASSLLATIDHTALRADTTSVDVDRLCREALVYGFAGVCVASSWIQRVHEALGGSAVRAVAVVGFPLGATTTATKAFEARDAVRLGADEIDMVVPLGRLKEGDWRAVAEDVRAVVEAAEGRGVKAILETAQLEEDEVVRAARVAQDAGVAFVKTSTGFGAGGASVQAVRLLRRTVGPDLGVKASGGIRTLTAARTMLQAGATRLGTSSGVAIAEAIASDTGSR